MCLSLFVCLFIYLLINFVYLFIIIASYAYTYDGGIDLAPLIPNLGADGEVL